MGLRNKIKEMADKCKELSAEPATPTNVAILLLNAEINLLRAVVDLDFIIAQTEEE